jgi:predicted acylesterase/phospholipase RssA/ABC-type phosphate/phosphonate transport system substrate-binding protein
VRGSAKPVSAGMMIILSFLFAPGTREQAFGADESKRQTIHVGVIYQKDMEQTQKQFYEILSVLSEKYPSIDFRLSVGNYEDVVEWYDKGQIDVAILSPGAVARLLLTERFDKEIKDVYVATYGLRPATNTLASRDRIAGLGDSPYQYKSVCLVSKAISDCLRLRGLDDLKSLNNAGRLKLVLIHPMSTSGSIVPRYVLKQSGVEWQRIPTEWTYNRDLSLERLLDKETAPDGKSEMVKVAFVTDETRISNQSKYQKLDIPMLEEMQIPQDAVVCSAKLSSEQQQMIKQIFSNIELPSKTDHGIYFKYLNDAASRYKKVKEWLREIDPDDKLTERSMTLDQIIGLLRNYKSLHKGGNAPLRLALVLSGGGAKCAYQMGAIAALEELDHYTDKDGNRLVDIDLVVGTSGGAINALAAALGATQDGEKRKRLAQTWQSFRQRDFLHPRFEVSRMLGFFSGMLQACVIIWLMLLLDQRRKRFWKKQEWWIPTTVVMLWIALIEAILGYFEITPIGLASLVQSDHRLLHLWTIFQPSLLWAGLVLLIVGLSLFIIGWVLSSRDLRFRDNPAKKAFKGARYLYAYRRWSLTVTAFILLALSFYYVKSTLLTARSLFDSAGIEQALADKLPRLLDQEDEGSEGVTEESLKRISEEIFDKRMFRRDLIITASNLRAKPVDPENPEKSYFTRREKQNQRDLYFYYDYPPKDPSAPLANDPNDPSVPGSDSRFVSLNLNRSALLDVVIGSSSIYPLFEAHKVSNCVREKDTQNLELIDGGFIHNSPLEAAWSWGATHVILIEASADAQPAAQEDLLDRFTSAFNYLYDQAQAADVGSRRRMEVFTLKPRNTADDRNLDLLDFSRDWIAKAIRQGQKDALAGSLRALLTPVGGDDDRPRFQRGGGLSGQDIPVITTTAQTPPKRSRIVSQSR